MERLPLIDVAEPERIAALTEAPDTVSFRADAAENLDGLVPDIGLTGKYPYRSVYRPRSFASASLAATLTHRFWDTIDGTSDHTGRRWIGVVMYDEHGFDCRLEVTLGADPIGCMVPFRHDNRRHLYVLDRPVQFMGEMEVLRLSGTGDAGYRLERVVLLEERPAATCYQPRIERLTARLRDAILGGVDWLLRRTYDAGSGHFRYTPCRHRGGGPQPMFTRQVIEGLAYAHALTGRGELRDMVERGLRDLGELPPASPEPDHSGFGKDWTSQTRYVPSLLAYLTRPPA